MTTAEAFRAAIAAAPDDMLPRLVFADWLDENGDPDAAAMIRLPTPTPTELISRWTAAGRRWHRRAKHLLAGVVPKAWAVWPIADPAAVPSPDGGTESWEARFGGTRIRSAKPLLPVAFRHGFIDAVAGTFRQLVRALPAVARVQPVRRVAVLNLHLEFEEFLAADARTRGTGGGRGICRKADRVPDAVWHRLAPPAEAVRYGGDTCRLYGSREEAFLDIGRAVLEWSRSADPV